MFVCLNRAPRHAPFCVARIELWARGQDSFKNVGTCSGLTERKHGFTRESCEPVQGFRVVLTGLEITFQDWDSFVIVG